MNLGEKNEKYGIDLAADPVFIPEGFEVIEHLRGEFVEWNPQKPRIQLVLTPGQGKGTQDGNKIRAELAGFDGTPINANALDFFLRNVPHSPWMIPEPWKSVENFRSKYILFWGTLYRYEGSICVRSLNWKADAREQQWKSGYCWMDSILNAQYPAAMLRKKPVQVEAPKVEINPALFQRS